MKKAQIKKTKPTLKLKLDRETLRALKAPDLKEVAGGLRTNFGSICVC
jgi:hypothetical protein